METLVTVCIMIALLLLYASTWRVAGVRWPRTDHPPTSTPAGGDAVSFAGSGGFPGIGFSDGGSGPCSGGGDGGGGGSG
jgi:hypothetical protein